MRKSGQYKLRFEKGGGGRCGSALLYVCVSLAARIRGVRGICVKRRGGRGFKNRRREV